MDARRFDGLSRTIAGRLSRRAALGGGAALAGATLTATGLRGLAAQDATPAALGATPEAGDAERTEFLFVQVFDGGSLAPKLDEPGVYTLTLTGATDQTVYFSDRPERIVGIAPMARFLDALGFTPDNPPNAALVAQTDAGEDIVVVELFNPVYRQGFGEGGGATLVYDVRILADYQEGGLAHLAARQVDDQFAETFGAASLFIDDCKDSTVICQRDGITQGQFGPMGFCWHFGDICCKPCGNSDIGHWEAQCNATFASCEGRCGANYWNCI